MLEFNRQLGKEFGVFPIKKYEVRSKSEKGKVRIVEQLANGKFVCDCPSHRECRHIRIVKNKLKGEKYEHRSENN